MNIIKVKDRDKEGFMPLLLLADEDRGMIGKYLHRGALFALYDGGLKSICVVTEEGGGLCELKNIATEEPWQGRGYASALIGHVSAHYRGRYQTMRVGTGDVPWIIGFYEKNGFRLSHRVERFFTDHYDHPIFDEGIQLVDMVYLSKDL